MFSISSLYDDYAHQTKGSLIGRIKDELSSLQGPRCASLIADLESCIRITEDYTNNHQKSKSAPKNDNGETIRRSGEAYINHLLRVTLILIHERLFDDDVVKAAIMHDLFEDTDYTYANAVENFGENVANLINCVTNVSDDSTKQYDEGVSAEERDYSGIINRCKEYPIAFYIKFADRLDNLMTLGAMPIANQKQKVEETENYIVPLVKVLKANRFLKYFQNVIFKIKESFRPEGKDDSYAIIRDRLKQLNAFASIKETKKKINAVFAKHFREIRVKAPTVFEIYSHLTENGIDIRKFSQSDFQYDFFFISSSGNDVPALSSVLSEFISGPLHDFAVVKIDKNESGGEVDEKRFTFVDNFKNRFQVHLLSTVNYTVQMYGRKDVKLPAVYPDTVYDTFAREQMVTFTPEGDPKMLPVGATAIDFAFKIHKDVLSQMVGAEVNGKKCDAYVRLKPNDVVRIITVENPRDRLPIEWIVNCETQDARRFIYGKIKRTIAQMDATIKELEKKPAQNNS